MPMLKSFSVTNFKNFKNKLTIDFSLIRNYDFNTHLIKNQLINKSLIYGFNATGKSNLGFAIMDINNHLTDKTKLANHYINYLNADSSDSLATFEYVFSLVPHEARPNAINVANPKTNNEFFFIKISPLISATMPPLYIQ